MSSYDPTGKKFTYAGIMTNRCGEEVEVLGPGDTITIPVKFPDGKIMGVNPKSLQ